jgi:hypothetical protein
MYRMTWNGSGAGSGSFFASDLGGGSALMGQSRAGGPISGAAAGGTVHGGGSEDSGLGTGTASDACLITVYQVG